MMLFQGAVGGETYVWRERAGEAGNFYKEHLKTVGHRKTQACSSAYIQP